MKLSIIIPTYNEEKVILACLFSLDQQNVKNFEVIIVDDESTDLTLQEIKQFDSINYQKVVLQQRHRGAGEARNLGAKKAQGNILVFVDADMTFDESFLKKLIEPILEGVTKGTFSKEEYVSNWENIWARCWNINQGWGKKRRHPENYPNKQKVFRAILKSEFQKVNGFSKGGYTDDWSLSEKLGYEAINAPKAIFYHSNPDSLTEVFTQASWSAKRSYKLGVLGSLVAVVRANPFFSILIGTYKSIKYKTPSFFLFKIIYDLGTMRGILIYIVTSKGSK